MLAQSLVGTVLAGKYRVDRVLGAGGMGVVVGATHIELDDRVAIKVLKPETARHRESVQRFLREGKIAARLESEHVARVRDVGRLDDGTPFLVMELLSGEDLQACLARSGPLPVESVVDLALQACEALAEAHAAGIVHRDLKPSNMFVTRRRNGEPCLKLLDFGISKLTDASEPAAVTQAAAVFGSPRYMSPEQLLSTTGVDSRTDVWSLAVAMYELLAGVPPFRGATLASVHLAILNDSPAPLDGVRPDVPGDLARTIDDALAKERAARTPTIGDFADALARHASPLGLAALETLRFTQASRHAHARSATGAAPPPTLARGGPSTPARGEPSTPARDGSPRERDVPPSEKHGDDGARRALGPAAGDGRETRTQTRGPFPLAAQPPLDAPPPAEAPDRALAPHPVHPTTLGNFAGGAATPSATSGGRAVAAAAVGLLVLAGAIATGLVWTRRAPPRSLAGEPMSVTSTAPPTTAPPATTPLAPIVIAPPPPVSAELAPSGSADAPAPVSRRRAIGPRPTASARPLPLPDDRR
ncbi:MAG: protein kinase [Labilithrix sp.]|nr:protein kinase [Labilithrix sp.]